ncbi:MAG: glycosyltransferase family 4 protein [Planctomycetota bacterium]
MRKCLLIAHDFPPAGGGGVQRPLKFVKYLPAFGWTTVVLTARRRVSVVEDPTLLTEVPSDVPVIRAWNPDLKEVMMGVGRRLGISYGAIDRLGAITLFPDDEVGWLFAALARGSSLCRKHRFDAIFATGGPWSSLMVGGFLSSYYRIPWIADFRDPWTEADNSVFATTLHRALAGRVQRLLLRRAAAVVVASPGMGNRMRMNFPETASKITTITNGYDEDDFSSVHLSNSKEFVVVFSGTLYAKRDPGVFLAGLRRFIDDHPAAEEDMAVRFMGRIPQGYKLEIDRLGLSNVVKYEGYQPHATAVRMVREATALVLVQAFRTDKSVGILGKLFEYLRSMRPMLYVGSPGETSDIIEKFKAGVTVTTPDLGLVASAIAGLYSKWKDGVPYSHIKVEELACYERKHLTSYLANVLDQVVTTS